MITLKRLIPRSIKNLRVIILAYKTYTYDILRYVKYSKSNSYTQINGEKKIKGLLTLTNHVIEKGLTMPETRLGFGKEVVMKLINLCQEYINNNYDQSSLEFVHSVRVLNEYIVFHKKNKFSIDPKLVNSIENLANTCGINEYSTQPEITRSTFEKDSNSNFKEFCKSRITVRNYIDKKINDDILNECLSMALKSPSACNRQPNNVYFIKDRKIKEQFLALQNGNRGFGHLSDTIIVFTSDLSVFSGITERNEAYLNSGMFSMTFIYALYSYGIGSCALNWSVSKEKDTKLRKLIRVPSNEVITMAVTCGYVPEKFKYAESPRLPINNFMHII